MSDGSSAAPFSESAERPAGGRSRWRRWLIRGVLFLVLPPALYFGASEIAMRVPVHAEVDPLSGSIDLYFSSNGTHVDVWIPVDRGPIDDGGRRWVDVLPGDFKTTRGGYLAVGWGDRAFYTQVPTWDDLTVPIALKGVLLPTESTLHITSWWAGPKLGESVHLVAVDEEGYRGLCDYILASVVLGPDGRMVPLDFEGHDLANDDRYFEARGSYHMFRTCNTWTNGALKAAGKRAAAWTPLARGVLHQLPKNGGERRPK